MAKITKLDKPETATRTISVKTNVNSQKAQQAFKWWNANSKKDLCEQMLSTVGFLKKSQEYRYRQAALYSRLYGNAPLFNFAGASLDNKMNTTNQLPLDRPTMNVVQSCIDTLVSRISQAKPRPVFLTDNGDSKERRLAKQMNSFIAGEFYQTKAYELGELALRDAAVLGTGCLKVYESLDHRVALDRVLLTELLVDPNDALYGNPRQLFQLKLVDRSMLAAFSPDTKSLVERAEQAYPDNSEDSHRTIADQVIVAEAWHLPSSKDAGDGLHVIACSSGIILEEPWTRNRFPFDFIHSSPRMTGFWGQGTSERLMGTQIEINKLLVTISRSINIVGVPRVWLEEGSKVAKAHINNDIGMIGTYKGTVPIFQDGTSGIAADVYAQLERLIRLAYQQEGISELAAQAQKPAGLNSGEAIRNYDDLQSDRFASLVKRYDNFYVDLAYSVLDVASDICEEQGSYSTVYPNKDGTKEIDLPEIRKKDDPYAIQCFNASSLPREPAGRLQKVTEMMQSGLISPQEGRRLLDFPDIAQVDKLENAGEERILKAMDAIVEDGKYTPPDPWMDLQLATKISTQYINLYSEMKIEEARLDQLRQFFQQVQDLKKAAMPQAPAGAAIQPQAVPEAPPVSEMLPNMPV